MDYMRKTISMSEENEQGTAKKLLWQRLNSTHSRLNIEYTLKT